ncbi:MAG: hypothetical protein Ta2F_02250 [Termitinemataceae bacterium]|nr:MAG: hypothetical protein Ta2F_02250 [Termitinemataceae bacterium]
MKQIKNKNVIRLFVLFSAALSFFSCSQENAPGASLVEIEKKYEGIEVRSDSKLAQIIADPKYSGVYALINSNTETETIHLNNLLLPAGFTFNLYGNFTLAGKDMPLPDCFFTVGGVLTVKSGSVLSLDETHFAVIGMPTVVFKDGVPDDTVKNAAGRINVESGGTLSIKESGSNLETIRFAKKDVSASIFDPLILTLDEMKAQTIALPPASVCTNTATGEISGNGFTAAADTCLNLQANCTLKMEEEALAVNKETDLLAIANAPFIVTGISAGAAIKKATNLVVQSGVCVTASNPIDFLGTLVVEGTLIADVSNNAGLQAYGNGTIDSSEAAAGYSVQQLQPLISGVKTVKISFINSDDPDDNLFKLTIPKGKTLVCCAADSLGISTPLSDIEVDGVLSVLAGAEIQIGILKSITINEGGILRLVTGSASIDPKGAKISGFGFVRAASTLISAGGPAGTSSWCAVGSYDADELKSESIEISAAPFLFEGENNKQAVIRAMTKPADPLVVPALTALGTDNPIFRIYVERPGIKNNSLAIGGYGYPVAIDVSGAGGVMLSGFDTQVSKLILKGGTGAGTLILNTDAKEIPTGADKFFYVRNGGTSDLTNTASIKKASIADNVAPADTDKPKYKPKIQAYKTSDAKIKELDVYIAESPADILSEKKLGSISGNIDNDAVIVSSNISSSVITLKYNSVILGAAK